MKLDMHFLDHHRKQFLDLHAELRKIEYSPQSEAALTNFKALLLLEIALLPSNDYDWSSPAVKDGGAVRAVLPDGSAHDDADDSGAEAAPVDDAAAVPAPAAGAAAASAAAADAARADGAPLDAAAPAAELGGRSCRRDG
jgi:hypothetical protein